jgi:hypothetical protein
MAILWPFSPNLWLGPYKVEREFKTELLTSYHGQEQRRSLRQTPRKTIKYQMAKTEECLRAFHASMETAQRTLLAIPDRVRFVRTTASLASGGTSVTVASAPSWLTTGRQIVLVSKAQQALRTVAGIGGLNVTFNETDTLTWPAQTRIHVSLQGYLNETIRGNFVSISMNTENFDVVFQVEPGTEIEAVNLAPITFEDREVFSVRPDKFAPVSIDYVQDGVSQVDFGYGRTKRFFPVSKASRLFEAQYTKCNAAKTDELRQFFDRQKGMRGEFFSPTFLPDIVPLSGISAAANSIAVAASALEHAPQLPGKLSLHLSLAGGNSIGYPGDAAMYVFAVNDIFKTLKQQILHNGLQLDVSYSILEPGNVEASFQKINASAADIDNIMSGYAPINLVSSSNDMTIHANRVQSWFSSSLSDPTITKRVMVMFASDPYIDGSTVAPAVTIMKDILDRTGSFSGTNNVECTALRLGEFGSLTGYYANFDNMRYHAGQYFSFGESHNLFNTVMDLISGKKFRAIAVEKQTGGWIFNRIGAIKASGPDAELLALDAWGEAVSLSEIKHISFMDSWRLASDNFVQTWSIDAFASAQFTFKRLI